MYSSRGSYLGRLGDLFLISKTIYGAGKRAEEKNFAVLRMVRREEAIETSNLRDTQEETTNS